MSNVNDFSSVLELPPFYFAEKDEIRIKYKGRNVGQIDWDFVSDQGRYHQKFLTAPEGYWYVASGFTCVGTYDANIRDKTGNLLATFTITIEDGDLASPKCESDGAGETGNEESESGNGTACATAICECIADLKQVNQGIGESVNSNGETLKEIKDNTAIANVKLENILGELKTDDFVRDGIMPVVDIPDVDGRLEEHKPEEHPVFEDDTIYFKDEGDADPVGKMPDVPDVKDWDGFKKEADGTKDSELTKDQEQKQDLELKKDNEKGKDKEMNLDSFEKESELQKDDFTKDEELKKDSYNQTDKFDQNKELEKTHVYEQTNKFP